MANLYKDPNHHLTKWEQELDEKLKDRKGFWEHLEEIRLEHPRFSDSFDSIMAPAFIFQREDDKIKLSRNYEQNKNFLDFALENYSKHDDEDTKRKEDDNSDGEVNYKTWPSFSDMFKKVNTPDKKVNAIVKEEVFESTDPLESSAVSIVVTNERSLIVTPEPTTTVRVKQETLT